MTAAGILPGALLANDPEADASHRNGAGRYLCRWVDLRVTGESPWLSGIEKLMLPIAHGEGKYFAPQSTLEQLQSEKAMALKYAEGNIGKHFDLPANPNGSIENIAGVTARNGRILGLMPHPERAVSFFHSPHWTYLKERLTRSGEPLPTEGPGLQIFRNAVNYFV